MTQPTPAPATPDVLLLCRDLMFVGKVTATARAAGVPLQVVRDPAQLPPQGRTLIADLNQPGTIEAAAAWKQATGGRVTGFVAHVDVEIIQRAQAAGLDEALPRSRFVQVLNQILAGGNDSARG